MICHDQSWFLAINHDQSWFPNSSWEVIFEGGLLFRVYISNYTFQIVLHREAEILSCECEMCYVHSLLSRIPSDLPMEQLASHAGDLFCQFPPDALAKEAEDECRRLWVLVLVPPLDPLSLSPILPFPPLSPSVPSFPPSLSPSLASHAGDLFCQFPPDALTKEAEEECKRLWVLVPLLSLSSSSLPQSHPSLPPQPILPSLHPSLPSLPPSRHMLVTSSVSSHRTLWLRKHRRTVRDCEF